MMEDKGWYSRVPNCRGGGGIFRKFHQVANPLLIVYLPFYKIKYVNHAPTNIFSIYFPVDRQTDRIR